jgi:amino acid efflux transporter
MRAVALYVGALLGPGLLFIPALAEQTAGLASIVAWIGLLLLPTPLAITFGALGIRYGGVSGYARAAFGERASRVTGVWFLTAVVLGAPAVALIGGYYVADLVGGGSQVAAALTMYVVVLAANAAGLRWSSGAQMILSFAPVALVMNMFEEAAERNRALGIRGGLVLLVEAISQAPRSGWAPRGRSWCWLHPPRCWWRSW